MIELDLPFPPSLNHYYRRVGPRTLISREGRAYRERVCSILAASGLQTLAGPLAITLEAHAPDRRRRDLDNLLKCTLDSCQHGGAFHDDGQADLLVVVRADPARGGRLIVRLHPYPLPRCPLCGGPW